MQTRLADFIHNTPAGIEAEQILRTCVHCGFCNATCPTYQLLGNELDGPRGRIYLIKQLLEGQPVSERTQLHLDRCLTCRSCESTCPSGVKYHRLADIGRELVEQQVERSTGDTLLRWALRQILPYRQRFTALLRLGQVFRPLLPDSLRDKVPAYQSAGLWPSAQHARQVLLLEGCVQPGIAPDINAATARVLHRLGVSVLRTPQAGCCGAVSYHLNAQAEGLNSMRRLIDAWWPALERGTVEAIIFNASGCGATVKEYGQLLADDRLYAAKAARVSELACDIGEFLVRQPDLSVLQIRQGQTLAFHSPCSLQHGLRLNGVVEGLLQRLGFQLTPVMDAHLCCGSAGTYSILQPELSLQLRQRKLEALQAGGAPLIATANIGCLAHLQSGTEQPVKHWVEVLDQALT